MRKVSLLLVLLWSSVAFAGSPTNFAVRSSQLGKNLMAIQSSKLAGTITLAKALKISAQGKDVELAKGSKVKLHGLFQIKAKHDEKSKKVSLSVALDKTNFHCESGPVKLGPEDLEKNPELQALGESLARELLLMFTAEKNFQHKDCAIGSVDLQEATFQLHKESSWQMGAFSFAIENGSMTFKKGSLSKKNSHAHWHFSADLVSSMKKRNSFGPKNCEFMIQKGKVHWKLEVTKEKELTIAPSPAGTPSAIDIEVGRLRFQPVSVYDRSWILQNTKLTLHSLSFSQALDASAALKTKAHLRCPAKLERVQHLLPHPGFANAGSQLAYEDLKAKNLNDCLTQIQGFDVHLGHSEKDNALTAKIKAHSVRLVIDAKQTKTCLSRHLMSTVNSQAKTIKDTDKLTPLLPGVTVKEWQMHLSFISPGRLVSNYYKDRIDVNFYPQAETFVDALVYSLKKEGEKSYLEREVVVTWAEKYLRGLKTFVPQERKVIKTPIDASKKVNLYVPKPIMKIPTSFIECNAHLHFLTKGEKGKLKDLVIQPQLKDLKMSSSDEGEPGVIARKLPYGMDMASYAPDLLEKINQSLRCHPFKSSKFTEFFGNFQVGPVKTRFNEMGTVITIWNQSMLSKEKAPEKKPVTPPVKKGMK